MTLLQDMRYAARMLRKHPLTSAIAVLTLALGIGANTAMFSLLRQLFVSSFQYKDLDTLVIVQSKNLERGNLPGGVSTPDLMDFRERNKVFDGMGTFRFTQYIVQTTSGVVAIRGCVTTPNLFTILGVPPVAGRLFREDEGAPGNEMVAILSEGLWTRQFARDPALLDKPVRLNGRQYTVVGVMPTGFFREGEIFTPMVITQEEKRTAARGDRSLRVWARLKAGVSVTQAGADLGLIARRLADEFPETNKGWEVHMLPPKDVVAQQLNIAGIIYYLPVGFVLLIACANVAHLQLARALEREREVALRTALGAGAFRIIQQLLSESVLIGLLGGAAGLGVAVYGVRLIQDWLPPEVTQSVGGLRIDREALQFMLMLAAGSGILFGFAPAWKASRVDLNHSLKEGSTKASASRGGKRLRNGMLVSEVALTTMLLAGAGLTLAMVGGGAYTDMGFQHKNLLGASTFLQSPKHSKPEALRRFAEEVQSRARALPGVTAATASSGVPLFGGGGAKSLVRVGDKEATVRRQSVTYQSVDAHYFQTLGISVVAGRGFTESDREGAAPVVVVNEELVRQHFGKSNAVGERIILNPAAIPGVGAPPPAAKPEVAREIIGVVKNVKQIPIDVLPQPAIAYVPYHQDPQQFVVLAVRTEGSAEGQMIPVSDLIQSVAPEATIGQIASAERQVFNALRLIRFLPMVLTVLAALGLILAGVGTYGITSYSVAQRSQEFGIRMALGARPADVLRMVIRQGLEVTLLGFAIGAAGAYALVKLLIAVIPPTGAPVPELITNWEIAVVCAVAIVSLGAISLLANYAPSRRATSIDPVVALRSE